MLAMRISLSPALVALAGLALVASCMGCRSSEWSGTWIGYRDLVAPPGANPYVTKTLARIRLEIRPDGTFWMRDGGIDVEGDVSGGSKQRELQVLRVLGREADEKIRYRLRRREDGSMLIEKVGSDQAPVVLRKRSQPSEALERSQSERS